MLRRKVLCNDNHVHGCKSMFGEQIAVTDFLYSRMKLEVSLPSVSAIFICLGANLFGCFVQLFVAPFPPPPLIDTYLLPSHNGSSVCVGSMLIQAFAVPQTVPGSNWANRKFNRLVGFPFHILPISFAAEGTHNTQSTAYFMQFHVVEVKQIDKLVYVQVTGTVKV